jgi:hypothetical protein
MEEKKYGKYFITECTRPRAESDVMRSGRFDMWKVEEMFPESNVTGMGVYYTKPHLMVSNIHIHEFDEYLFFLGTNSQDMDDFDAEVHLNIGEEGEKYIITAPTIVYVPAKLAHCPLNFVKVNKPVFFFHVRVERK